VRTLFNLTSLALSAVLACGAISAFAAPVYDLVELTGAAAGEAYGLNNRGQVAGQSMTGPRASSRGFIYNKGHAQKLNPLPGDFYSDARAINNAGQVTGTSGSTGGSHAVVFQNGVTTSLGGDYTGGWAINASGQVAGYVWSPTDIAYHAALFENGAVVDLGTLGGIESYAYGINAAKQVVGSAQVGSSTGETHAFLYDQGAMKDLGTLGGSFSQAMAINKAGWVVGIASLANAVRHAFVYHDGQMTDLGSLGPLPYNTIASDINTHRQIVGTAMVNPRYGVTSGFLHDGRTMASLDSLLAPEYQSAWSIRNAYAINDKGQISGKAVMGNQWRAVLLTPRP